jgi:hypothetical protein
LRGLLLAAMITFPRAVLAAGATRSWAILLRLPPWLAFSSLADAG